MADAIGLVSGCNRREPFLWSSMIMLQIKFGQHDGTLEKI
jgi:hypothetical protein